MSHAYVVGNGVPDYLVETWFNPPGTQALATPGWFDRHYELMHGFRRLASAGVLVGTTTPGRVTDWRGRVLLQPSEADLDRVLAGLVDAARIFLEAGAPCVMPATVALSAVRAGRRHSRRARRDPRQRRPAAHERAPAGRERGRLGRRRRLPRPRCGNVYLCDASAFPSSVRVNPQLTVMGLAEYAARRILGDALPELVAPADAAAR